MISLGSTVDSRGTLTLNACKNVFVTDGACMTSTGNQSPSILYMALTARAVDYAVNAIKENKSPIIIDTDMYVMKVWSEYVFGNCPSFILDEINKQHYDLYLLCKPDIPWVKDELREYPDEKPRQELFQIYKDILINQQTPWVEISGDFETRNQKAVTAINAVLAH